MSERWDFPSIDVVLYGENNINEKKSSFFENNKDKIFDEIQNELQKNEFENGFPILKNEDNDGNMNVNDEKCIQKGNLQQENVNLILQTNANNITHIEINGNLQHNQKNANEINDINYVKPYPKEKPTLDNLFASLTNYTQNYVETIRKFQKAFDASIFEKIKDYKKKCDEKIKNDVKKKIYKEKVLYLKLREICNQIVSFTGGKETIQFRCNNCEETNFNGCRYTCNKCQNKYHLCEACILIIGPIHPRDHLFKCFLTSIINPIENIKSNSKNNSELIDISNTIFEFPYKKAEDNLSIDITMKNIGTKRWDNNTVADFIDLSDIPTPVSECNVGEIKSFTIVIHNINNLEVGNYIKQVCLKNSEGFFGTIIDIRIKITQN